MTTTTDFTPTGLKLEGTYENDRNGENHELFSAMIREAYGVKDVICGHHLVYMAVDRRKDPATGIDFDYQVVQEVPSADALIFDHTAMTKIFGQRAIEIMTKLAALPVEGGARDKALGEFYFGRAAKAAA